jgi:hypothetical protein
MLIRIRKTGGKTSRLIHLPPHFYTTLPILVSCLISPWSEKEGEELDMTCCGLQSTQNMDSPNSQQQLDRKQQNTIRFQTTFVSFS